MDLQEYEQIKFSLADVVRASLLLVSEEAREVRQGLNGLQSRLAEDRFNLVFVGRFSRGKSSLLNALLGTERLPTGIVPLTSVITTVTYGSKEQLVVRYRGRGLDSRATLSRLSEFVTQDGNPGNEKDVAVAEIQLPVELLRRGFFFVDTPGLGSSIVANTRTTESYLPEADAFVLVTGYESPLSEDELQLLQEAVRSGKKIFVVLNKQDIASESERTRVIDYVSRQLEASFPGNSFSVFSTSAREGLLAKQGHNARLLTSSGIEAFEAELQRFVIESRQHEFLVQISSRIRSFIADLDASPHKDELIRRLTEVKGRFDDSPSTWHQAVNMGSMGLAASWYPCEICERTYQAGMEFLRVYQYQLATDSRTRQRHAEAGGFCPLHTWQYESIASPQGISTGYPPLLQMIASRIAEQADTLESGSQSARNFELLQQQCPMCEIAGQAEEQAVEAVSTLERSAWSDSRPSALCFPHLRDVIVRMEDPASAGQLLRRSAALLQRVSEDMQRYAIKWEGVRRYLVSDEEKAAYVRGLFLLAGKRSLAMARPVK